MKKMTIDQVATAAGVSKSTVSRYLNGNFQKMSDSTRERIQATIRDLNYHPNRQAQTLKTKKTGLIGVVVADMANLYSAKMISGAGKVARVYQYQLLIMDSNNSFEQEHESLRQLQDQSLEGLIIQPMSRKSADYQKIIGELPTVFVDRVTDSNQWPFVGVDNYEATRHLGSLIAKRGYQRILIISEPIDVSQARFDRVRGVKEIARRNKIQCELLEITESVPPEIRHEIKQKIGTLTQNQEPTVIFASNSRLLMQVMQLINDLQLRIPADIGLCGFDDWHWTALTNPPIVSIEQDAVGVGQAAMTTVINQLERPDQVVKDQIIASTLNVRASI